MFMSANKKATMELQDKTLDLKETKKWETDGPSQVKLRQKEATGNYEFTLTLRALFAPDGTILPRQDKS